MGLGFRGFKEYTQEWKITCKTEWKIRWKLGSVMVFSDKGMSIKAFAVVFGVCI